MVDPAFDVDLASTTLSALAHPARLTVMKLVLEREWDVKPHLLPWFTSANPLYRNI